MPVLIHENMSRGRTRKGWLDSYHTFSFGGFMDPTRMGFGNLRVINEDFIIPGAGFSSHEHHDVDILTMVKTGRVRHEDSLGNIAEIVPGIIQMMRAGTGITHSEINASSEETAHVLQIWIVPKLRGGPPFYDQTQLPPLSADWAPIASGRPGAAALQLGSDTELAVAFPRDGDMTEIGLASGRQVFLQIVDGIAMIGGERLTAGDGLQAEGEKLPPLHWQTDGCILRFDMGK